MCETQWKEMSNHLRYSSNAVLPAGHSAFFVKITLESLDGTAVCVPERLWSVEHGCSDSAIEGQALSKWGQVVVGRFLKLGMPQCGQERRLFCSKGEKKSYLPKLSCSIRGEN